MTEEIKKKIIVVEDDPFLYKVFSVKLVSAGFEAVSVKDGLHVVDIVKKELPNLILLDVMLPHKSGFDILVELKQDEATKDIPVFIMSNLGQEAEMKRGLELGAKEYLVKTNIKLDDMVEKINNYLK